MFFKLGLDLLTRLLTPASKTPVLIDEINTVKNDSKDTEVNENNEKQYPSEKKENEDNHHLATDDDQVDDNDNNDGDEWYLEQKVNDFDESHIQLTKVRCKYGFAQTKSNVFSRLSVS